MFVNDILKLRTPKGVYSVYSSVITGQLTKLNQKDLLYKNNNNK